MLLLKLKQNNGQDDHATPDDLEKQKGLPQKDEREEPGKYGLQGRRDARPGGPDIVDPCEKKTEWKNGPNDGDVENPSPLGKAVSRAKISEGRINHMPRERGEG